MPTAPPIPATKAGAAPDDETGPGALVLGLELAELEAGTLVVTAVTEVVLVEVVDRGAEDVLATEAEDEDAEVVAFRLAENWEQRAKPTWAARLRSVALQLLTRQGVTAVWMAGWPVPHWQATSVGLQPATEMAELRQDVAQAGSPLKFCAVATLTTAARARMENFITIDYAGS